MNSFESTLRLTVEVFSKEVVTISMTASFTKNETNYLQPMNRNAHVQI
jgi:hypothetical protein